MGVEVVLRDAFRRAQDYRRNWDEYDRKVRATETVPSPPEDLELDELRDILRRQGLCTPTATARTRS